MGSSLPAPSGPAMGCPECLGDTAPLSGSTPFLAWYVCALCGHFWSARIRDGCPVAEVPIAVARVTAH
jgi:hypothetical protein